MIKKYIVEQNSVFNKSIILSLYESGNFGFTIEGLTNEDRNILFPINPKIQIVKNEVNINSLPAHLLVVYLDESFVLKALILKDKRNKFFLFRSDHQKARQLNIHNKYIGSNIYILMDEYEQGCKSKGKSYYDGEGDFNQIKDFDYFENLYQKEIDNHINKDSNVFRLLFNNNNMFTADFTELVEKKRINIVNASLLDKKIFTLASMEKNKNDRKDCLLIDSETKDIKYLIYTYKPHFIKHFLLLKNLGNNQFEFVKETICFSEIFTCEGIKGITYKKASELAIRSFAKMHYENFYNEYISFELEEEFDEEVQSNLIVEQVQEAVVVSLRDELIKESIGIIRETGMELKIKPTMHGKERVLERIGQMNDEEMSSLLTVAYEKGYNSVHFLEKDPIMFKFLQYHQNKKRGKTLRFYKGVLFFFTLEPPHDLVTCFLYQTNYEKYISAER